MSVNVRRRSEKPSVDKIKEVSWDKGALKKSAETNKRVLIGGESEQKPLAGSCGVQDTQQ